MEKNIAFLPIFLSLVHWWPVYTNAVASIKLAVIKANLKEGKILAGNGLRIIHRAMGEHFCGRGPQSNCSKVYQFKQENKP